MLMSIGSDMEDEWHIGEARRTFPLRYQLERNAFGLYILRPDSWKEWIMYAGLHVVDLVITDLLTGIIGIGMLQLFSLSLACHWDEHGCRRSPWMRWVIALPSCPTDVLPAVALQHF